MVRVRLGPRLISMARGPSPAHKRDTRRGDANTPITIERQSPIEIAALRIDDAEQRQPGRAPETLTPPPPKNPADPTTRCACIFTRRAGLST